MFSCGCVSSPQILNERDREVHSKEAMTQLLVSLGQAVSNLPAIVIISACLLATVQHRE